jgi:putative transposase
LKGRLSRAIDSGEGISKGLNKRRERGIWQRRFWAHFIEAQKDYNRHMDYIHWNVGITITVIDLPKGHKGRIPAFSVMLNKVFIQKIGEP